MFRRLTSTTAATTASAVVCGSAATSKLVQAQPTSEKNKAEHSCSSSSSGSPCNHHHHHSAGACSHSHHHHHSAGACSHSHHHHGGCSHGHSAGGAAPMAVAAQQQQLRNFFTASPVNQQGSHFSASFHASEPQTEGVSVSRVSCPYCTLSFPDSFEGRSQMRFHLRGNHWDVKPGEDQECVHCKGKYSDFHMFYNHLDPRRAYQCRRLDMKDYKCPYCPTTFEGDEKVATVMNHIKEAHWNGAATRIPGEDPFQCSSCFGTFTDFNQFWGHLDARRGLKCQQIGTDYNCGHCDRKFKPDETVYAVRRHMEEHFNEQPRGKTNPFTCSKCGDEFVNFQRFSDHMDWDRGLKCRTIGRTVNCPYCDTVFDGNKGQSAIRKHIEEAHWKFSTTESRTTPFRCFKCDGEFKHFNQLWHHFDFRKGFECKVAKKTYPCSYCDMKFDNEESAKNHLLEEHWRGDLVQRSPAFECQHCDRDFTKFTTFLSHFDWKRGGRCQHSTHGGDASKSFTGGFGSKASAASTTGANESVAPGGVDPSHFYPVIPFECPYCPEMQSPSFGVGKEGAEAFHSHYLKEHWGEDPMDRGERHVCSRCGDGFWNFDHFLAHMTIRTGVKCRTLGFRIDCPFCDKEFDANDKRSQVRYHFTSHWRGDKFNRRQAFECVCGAGFTSFDDFWRHFSFKHGGMDCTTSEEGHLRDCTI